VQEKIAQIKNLASEIELKDAVGVLQLFYNSIYLVGGPGGVRHLLARDTSGKYYNDGPLLITDKPGIKDLTAKIALLVKPLGECKNSSCLPSPSTGSRNTAMT
jgi:hypothetical protein